MKRAIPLTIAVLLLGAEMAHAGPIMDWLFPAHTANDSYSPAYYWAPGAARLSNDIHGPKLPVYAPDRHPEIPPNEIIKIWDHPTADAASTLIPVPTPPATSKFKY